LVAADLGITPPGTKVVPTLVEPAEPLVRSTLITAVVVEAAVEPVVEPERPVEVVLEERAAMAVLEPLVMSELSG